jgi:hypothetical protein
MSHSRPQTRQVREHGQAKDWPQLRLIRVRGQSVTASSPCHQAREQSVRSRDKDTVSTGCQKAAAADGNRPQTDRNPALSTSAASFLTKIGCEPEQAQSRPSGGIVMATPQPTRSPVYVRNILVYVLI